MPRSWRRWLTPGIGCWSTSWAMSHAQSLPSGLAAEGRRGPRAVDAVAADGPRPAVSPALRYQWPCLAGPVQGVPVQDDDHLVAVLRYVERNPVRAERVARAEDWAWSILPGWRQKDPFLYSGQTPVRGPHWLRTVNAPLSAGDLQRLRHSVSRGRPFGDEGWTRKMGRAAGPWSHAFGHEVGRERPRDGPGVVRLHL